MNEMRQGARFNHLADYASEISLAEDFILST